MPVIDTSVILCGLAFPDSYSGRLLREIEDNQEKGILSNTIEEEVKRVASTKAPYLIDKIDKFINSIKKNKGYYNFSQQQIQELCLGHINAYDRHVVAAAVLSGEKLIYTLNYEHFLGGVLERVTNKYGIVAEFPDVRIEDMLKNAADFNSAGESISTNCGSITMIIGMQYPSKNLSSIKDKWYVLDMPGMFGLWYGGNSQSFVFEPYRLGNQYLKHIKMPFSAGQTIRFTVTYRDNEGYDIYVDDKKRTCKGKWIIDIGHTNIFIGSDSSSKRQISLTLIALRFFVDKLSEKVIKKMHRYRIISLSDSNLEIDKLRDLTLFNN